MSIRNEARPAAASVTRPGVVYINGEFRPTDQAVVSVFDHGLLYGDGVFDTMFATYGYIFKLRSTSSAFGGPCGRRG